MTLKEQIGVKLPDGTHHLVTIQVSPLEDDIDILKRFSPQAGTVFNVMGTKYRVISADPLEVKKVSDSGEPLPKVLPAVGEVWKPKDPRRIAKFTVVEVDGDSAVTDDGRRIQLARFHRYERC